MTKQIIKNFPHNLVRPVRPYNKPLYLTCGHLDYEKQSNGQKSWRVVCYVVCENRLVGNLVYQPESAKLIQNGVIYSV